jgi:hypothetical protein
MNACALAESERLHRLPGHFHDERRERVEHDANPIARRRFRNHLSDGAQENILGTALGHPGVEGDLARAHRQKHATRSRRVLDHEFALGRADCRRSDRPGSRRMPHEQVGADQLGHERRPRPPEQFVPGARLDYAALLQHDDLVPEHERLDRAVGDIDRDAWELLEQRAQLAPHAPTGLEVE